MGMRARDGVLAIALGLVLAATPAFAQAPLAQTPPPPVQVERPTPSPGQQYVWIAGHWAWNGQNYGWVAGRWMEAQGNWIPGRHVRTPQGWVYQEGRWRK
jgi:hypothetical protein